MTLFCLALINTLVCQKMLVLLSVPMFLHHLLWMPVVRGNHNKWWTCNEACARCVRRVTPMEDMIIQLYPGLFSTTPPFNNVPASQLGTFPGATGNYSVSKDTSLTSRAGKVNTSNTTGSNESVYVDSISAKPVPSPSGGFGCCETVMEYVTPPNVTIDGKPYKVVHLRHMFQFIPIGRCKPDSTCATGRCENQLRAHWVLVYNNTRPLQGAAPVSFVPVEVFSHCECLNIG